MHLNLTCFVSMQYISTQIEDFYSGNKGFFIGKLYTPKWVLNQQSHPSPILTGEGIFIWTKSSLTLF